VVPRVLECGSFRSYDRGVRALGYFVLFCFMFVFPAINFGFWLKDQFQERDEWTRELEVWGP